MASSRAGTVTPLVSNLLVAHFLANGLTLFMNNLVGDMTGDESKVFDSSGRC